ncbi:MAG: cytochrome c4 [Paucibacter sp.]|nr:cytochrome c4 [Roseateles sp.]
MPYLAGAALAMLGVGCANVERSRNVADPAVPGAVLAQQVCSMCHGAGGSAESPNFPNLAGQNAPYVVNQLKNFRSHNRRDPAGYEYMWGLSRSLSDDQIDALAAYFSATRLKPQVIEGTASQIAAGAAIFRNGAPGKDSQACVACHGEKAEGNTIFPRLAGQHMDYLIKQLTIFQRTDERSDPSTMPTGMLMKGVAHSLDDKQIVEVAAYAQSLRSQ